MRENTGERITKIKTFAEHKMGVFYRSYIQENYHPHCIENLDRIIEGQGLTKEMEVLLEKWNKDHRTSREYFLDILYGWMAEDYVHRMVRGHLIGRLGVEEQAWTLSKSGADESREFRLPKDMPPDTDLCLVHETGKIIGLEVIQDHYGYIKGKGHMDLRHRKGRRGKFECLLEKSRDANYEAVYLLVIDHKWQKLGLIPVNEGTRVLKTYYNADWGKMVTMIEVDYPKTFKHLTLGNMQTGRA